MKPILQELLFNIIIFKQNHWKICFINDISIYIIYNQLLIQQKPLKRILFIQNQYKLHFIAKKNCPLDSFYIIMLKLFQFFLHRNFFVNFKNITNFYVIVSFKIQSTFIAFGYFFYVIFETFQTFEFSIEFYNSVSQ